MKAAFATLSVLALAACTQVPQGHQATTSAPASASTKTSAAVTVPASSTPSPDAAATLPKYHWRLASAVDSSGQRIDALFARTDKPLQLDFDARGMSVGNTCNRMHGGYSIANEKLVIDPLASTMMACPDPKLMALDAATGKYLAGTLAFVLSEGSAPPTLTLTTAGGDKLAFTGMPTAETRFGGTGETMFFEIAPETRPCSHPGMQNAQCLYVRELHYDAQGLHAGEPGAWHVLGQDIEGYAHEAGVRNVLRVKHYKVANPPADASSVAYVLDMVVATEAAPRSP